jgi:hypothetical protein
MIKRHFAPLFALSLFVVTLFVPLQAPPAHAATVDWSTVYCQITFVRGRIESTAPYVKVAVTLASDLSRPIASTVVRVWADQYYYAFLRYPLQPKGTRLIISAGEWDGSKYVAPANLIGQDCAKP